MDARFTYDQAKHLAWIDGIPALSVTDVLRHIGFIDPTWFTAEARSRGDIVHAVTAGLDRGLSFEWADLDQKLHGYVKSWISFKQQTRIDILDVEVPGYHPLYKFWGTRDICFMLNGQEWLCDKKTGMPPYWTRWQTAAYDMLAGSAIKPRRRASIQLFDDGSTARMIEYGGAEHYNDGAEFLAFLIAVRRRLENGIGN